jgi:O-antigen ligase
LSQPWAYELYYLALLYQTGLLGLAAYAAGIGWLYYSALKLIRRSELAGRFMAPIIVGMSCFLVANATNPYLPKFDGIWTIFLPAAVINYWLLVGRDFDCFNPRAAAPVNEIST